MIWVTPQQGSPTRTKDTITLFFDFVRLKIVERAGMVILNGGDSFSASLILASSFFLQISQISWTHF